MKNIKIINQNQNFFLNFFKRIFHKLIFLGPLLNFFSSKFIDLLLSYSKQFMAQQLHLLLRII